MDDLKNEAKTFLLQNRAMFPWLLCAAILSYGFAIVTYSLSIDEEIHSVSDLTYVWAEQGRWGITLFKLLLGTNFPLPFFQPAVAVLGLIAAAIAWSFTFALASNKRLTGSPWLTVFAVLYVTMPCNAYYLSFNTYNIELSLASLLAALGTLFSFQWAIQKRGSFALIAAVIFTALAIATYQVFLIVCLAGLLISYLLYLESLPRLDPLSAQDIVQALRFALTLILGYSAYRGVDAIASPKGIYVDTFFNWGKLDSSYVIESLRAYAVDLLKGRGFEGGRIVPALAIAALVTIVATLARTERKQAIVRLLILLAIFLSPFALSVGLGTPMPNRTQQVLPLAFSAFVLIIALQLGMEKRGQTFALVAIVAVIVLDARANTWISFSEYSAFRRDERIAHSIVERLAQLGWPGRGAPLAVVGIVDNSSAIYLRSETVGASFYDWDLGSRAPFFMRALGYSFEPPDSAQWKTALTISQAMSNWPQMGSVAYSDGIVIVKMGEATKSQISKYR